MVSPHLFIFIYYSLFTFFNSGLKPIKAADRVKPDISKIGYRDNSGSNGILGFVLPDTKISFKYTARE
jgi:hypothetical protein